MLGPARVGQAHDEPARTGPVSASPTALLARADDATASRVPGHLALVKATGFVCIGLRDAGFAGTSICAKDPVLMMGAARGLIGEAVGTAGPMVAALACAAVAAGLADTLVRALARERR